MSSGLCHRPRLETHPSIPGVHGWPLPRCILQAIRINNSLSVLSHAGLTKPHFHCVSASVRHSLGCQLLYLLSNPPQDYSAFLSLLRGAGLPQDRSRQQDALKRQLEQICVSCLGLAQRPVPEGAVGRVKRKAAGEQALQRGREPGQPPTLRPVWARYPAVPCYRDQGKGTDWAFGGDGHRRLCDSHGTDGLFIPWKGPILDTAPAAPGQAQMCPMAPQLANEPFCWSKCNFTISFPISF